MKKSFSAIRFMGYVIPTTPAKMIPIGDPNSLGAMAGSYLGKSDAATDFDIRIAVLKNAVDEAKARLPSSEDGVINLFLAPEFFFHGAQGPYLYRSKADDPVDAILKKLEETFPAIQYPNWCFVFGSVSTTQVAATQNLWIANSTKIRNAVVKFLARQWQNAYGPMQGMICEQLSGFISSCQCNPALEVRDRALIVSNIPLYTTQNSPIGIMTTEKYYDSGEDFLLYDVKGRQDVVTEQMTAYPHIDLSNGDLKKSARDKYALFHQIIRKGKSMYFGIEICLDHFDARLRRNLYNPHGGVPVHVQLVPSCGMQISRSSVVADANGFVFNCDGQYPLDDTVIPQEGVQNDVRCIYANYVDLRKPSYGGHTQLARVKTPAKGETPNGRNASFQCLDPADITIVPITAVRSLKECFAGGPGQVHIYGLHAPYILYP